MGLRLSPDFSDTYRLLWTEIYMAVYTMGQDIAYNTIIQPTIRHGGDFLSVWIHLLARTHLSAI